MNIRELLEFLKMLMKENENITMNTRVVCSGDEEGNSFGSAYAITGPDGNGFQTDQKNLVNHEEDCPDDVVVIWPLT